MASPRRKGSSSPIILAGPEFEIKAVRAALALRASEDATPPFLADTASLCGTRGIDAFLCHLGGSISAALRAVPHGAEAAQAELCSMREMLHAAVDARCDALQSDLSRAESKKTTELERELVAVDTMLERWRSETRVVADAVSSLSDAKLMSRHAELASRLDGLEVQLGAIPTAPVELSHISLFAQTAALQTSIASFGHVVSPVGVLAADLSLRGVPSCLWSSQTLQLSVVLGARHSDQTAEELEVSLGALNAAFRFDVRLYCPSDAHVAIHAVVTPCPAKRCLRITVTVPHAVPRAAYLTVQGFYFSHKLCAAPVVIPFQYGLRAPLILRVSSRFPCVTSDGRLFLPSTLQESVMVFDANGSPLPSLTPFPLDMRTAVGACAISTGTFPQLLLGKGRTLVSLDSSKLAVRWTKHGIAATSIAALSKQGIAVVATSRQLCTIRDKDGSPIGRAIDGAHCPVAADSESGLVFTGTDDQGDSNAVNVWSWDSSAEGGAVEALVPLGPVSAAGLSEHHRIIAVVPPSPGKRASYLIVGSSRDDVHDSKLLVLSLPGLALVHTHSLRLIKLLGLAADPCGTVLVVCDMLRTHVLAWPLPGMPQLE